MVNCCLSWQDLSNVREIPGVPTSCYVGLLSREGQVHGGIMNMDIHAQITPDYVRLPLLVQISFFLSNITRNKSR